MHFQAAYAYLKTGKAITLPEWGGYWSWGERRGTILMHTRKGEIIDIRQSENWDYTQGFMFRQDWELVDDIHATEHYQARHGLFGGICQRSISQPAPAPSPLPPGRCLLCQGYHSPSLPCPEAQTWSRG